MRSQEKQFSLKNNYPYKNSQPLQLQAYIQNEFQQLQALQRCYSHIKNRKDFYMYMYMEFQPFVLNFIICPQEIFWIFDQNLMASNFLMLDKTENISRKF